MGTLKSQSNGQLYSNTVIDTLAVDGWAVTFGTVNTIQYNERFVRRRSTNRPGAPYNNNNKSVRTIKQNSFKSFLKYVSVSNVIVTMAVSAAILEIFSIKNGLTLTSGFGVL